MLLTKRIKFIRDSQDQIKFLDKKIKREISKLNQNIEKEVKKRLRKFSPGVQLKIRGLDGFDFRSQNKRSVPLSVSIELVNGKNVHESGFWVEEIWENGDFKGSIKVENILTVEQLKNLCFELSEDLGVEVKIFKVPGKIIY